MDKGDWKEAKRHEKAAAAGVKTETLGESTSATPQSPSSSSGVHTQRIRRQTRIIPRWMRCGACCGHVEVWTHAHCDGTPSGLTVRLACPTYYSLLNSIVLNVAHVIPMMSRRDHPSEILLSSNCDIHPARHEHTPHYRISEAQTAAAADIGPRRDSSLTYNAFVTLVSHRR